MLQLKATLRPTNLASQPNPRRVEAPPQLQ